MLDELYDALKESVAETSEEFMDKYFSGEDFTYAEMIQGQMGATTGAIFLPNRARRVAKAAL